MRFPKTLIVHNEKWKIQITSLGRGVDGEVNCEDKVIRISRKLNRQQRWSTLIHEILHICWELSTEQGDLKGVYRRIEEHIVEGLEENLYTILKDNFRIGP